MVQLAPMPNLFRGEHRGPDAADRDADAYSDVLRVKPPLCCTQESGDFFVDRLDQVLTEGW